MRTLPSIALGLCCLSAPAQRLTILLDPARGGTEDGARIEEHTVEKQVTLDLANRLRSLLNARDFNVVLTRESDMTVTNDARAALANQARPVACLLLHATAAGKGLHLFTSSLPQVAPQTLAVPWDEAQAPFAERSKRLDSELATAFGRSKIPVSSGHTWIRPLDNMQCPALAIEIAPSGKGETAANREYQTRIADAIAGAMLFWRGHTDMVQSIVAPPPVAEPKPVTPAGGSSPAAQPAATDGMVKPRPAVPSAPKTVPDAAAKLPIGAAVSTRPATATRPAASAAPFSTSSSKTLPVTQRATKPQTPSARPAPTTVRPAEGSSPQ